MGCQYYARQPHVPAEELRTIPITWLFAVWELDMVGLLQTTPCGFTHLLVAVDKFTKWIEAKPIRKLDGATALRFFRDLVVRFGLPHSIITDNAAAICHSEKWRLIVGRKASDLTLHLWHTHNPTVRLSEPMD